MPYLRVGGVYRAEQALVAQATKDAHSELSNHDATRVDKIDTSAQAKAGLTTTLITRSTTNASHAPLELRTATV